ncbi:MAG: metallophosphoesterase family protein [Candidatus Fermentibacteraceae bacterium]
MTGGTALRLRIVSDIHGNLPALERVLAHPAGTVCDRTICLGDITGYGPWPSQCIALVRESCDGVAAGNHDLGCAGLLPHSRFNVWGAAAIDWTARQLSDTETVWLAGLPLTIVAHGIGFCHAHPVVPGSWEYILGAGSAREVLNETPGETWFYGHTHRPCAWGSRGVRTTLSPIDLRKYPLVNCGSVGQPRDGDPRASFMVVDTDAQTAENIRVSYPVDATAQEINKCGLPPFLAERLFTGR